MVVSAHHTKAEQVIPPKGIICGLHMHTVAGIVRPQGAAGIVKDRIAVDENTFTPSASFCSSALRALMVEFV